MSKLEKFERKVDRLALKLKWAVVAYPEVDDDGRAFASYTAAACLEALAQPLFDGREIAAAFISQTIDFYSGWGGGHANELLRRFIREEEEQELEVPVRRRRPARSPSRARRRRAA